MSDFEIIVFGLRKTFYRDKTILKWFDQLREESGSSDQEEQNEYLRNTFLNCLYTVAELEVKDENGTS